MYSRNLKSLCMKVRDIVFGLFVSFAIFYTCKFEYVVIEISLKLVFREIVCESDKIGNPCFFGGWGGVGEAAASF